MRAVVLHALGDPDHLKIEQRPDLHPGTGEAVVGLRAAALNHRDVWIRRGQYAGIKLPIVLGSDGAGQVVEIGEGVDPGWKGRDVIIDPSLNWGPDEGAQGSSFNILGLPACAVPVGSDDGLPQGVQLIGARFREDLVLDAAQAVEDRAPVLTPIQPRVAVPA